MSDLNKLKEKFKVNEYKLYESDHWVWSLRPHQVTLGSGILSLKRECLAFSELEAEEFADLKNITKVIESSLKKSFDYDVMNYLMLMMFDRHVHYHVIPRYEKLVEALGESWIDENWPAIPALLGDPMPEDKIENIAILIKKNI